MNQLQTIIRRFSIRVRMHALVVMVIGLLALGGMAGVVGGLELKALSVETSTSAIALVRDNALARTSLQSVRLHERDMVIDYDDGPTVIKHQVAWIKSIGATHKALESLRDSTQHDERTAVTRAIEALTAYTDTTKKVLGTMQSGGFENAKQADEALLPAKVHVSTVETAIDTVSSAVDRDIGLAQEDLDSSLNQAGLAFLGGLGFIVLLIVPMTWLNARSVLTPIAYASKVARSIATGDLSKPITAEGCDEATGLVTALAQMQDSLRRLVGDVRTSANSIQQASAEVAAGNQDLSSRTEAAASSLQQTAGSTAQLTGTVRQSADAAVQANQLAQSASLVARRGGDAVLQVVGTMQDIDTSSRKIADIIGVVDSIAFQTNILALNAAVEAARAGEHGRGFAVVASEVRSLAQRSSDAAREIKGLIGASVERVQTGTRLVHDAGATMSEIVTSVQRVSDIIAEIAASVSEQNQGIGRINSSVGQLDQMTQQNAALVEQSAAAAESLNEQARRLGGVMSTFRLHTSEPARVAASLS